MYQFMTVRRILPIIGMTPHAHWLQLYFTWAEL